MRAHRMRALSGALSGGLVFVGGAAIAPNTSQTPSINLDALTGGVATAPAAGDIVIVCVGFLNSTDRNIQCTTTGYTEVTDLFSSSLQMAIYYKLLTTAETSVSFDLGVFTAGAFVIHVWRKINSTPLDATTTTATSHDPPSITTVSAKAVVVAVSYSSSSTGPTVDTTNGMDNVFSRFQSGGTSQRLVIASKLVSAASTYDPPSLTNGSTSGISATLALRPA